MVKVGFWLWQLSDFKRFPTRKEAEQVDPDWVSDLIFARRVWKYANNDSPLMKMANEYARRKAENTDDA